MVIATLAPLDTCERCGRGYFWKTSTSTCKMTYCGSLCEKAALGFTIEGFIRTKLERKDPPVPAVFHRAVGV